MINININGREMDCATPRELEMALRQIAAERQFELWVSIPGGPALSMLRNGEDAFLVHFAGSDDAGFTSSGDQKRIGDASYRVNGQIDEYPLSWCIGIENCLKAIEYFCTHEGRRPEGVEWREN